jgi:putative peptide zinc metalloprotease protein
MHFANGLEFSVLECRDSNTLDLSQQYFCLAADVLVWPVSERGQLVYQLEIPQLHRFFRAGQAEYQLLSLLNGEHTLPQICGKLTASQGRDALSAAEAEFIVRWFLHNEIIHIRGETPPNRQPASHKDAASTTSWLRRLNPFWLKVSLPHGDKIVAAIASRCSRLFSIPIVFVGLLTILLAMSLLFANWRDFSAASPQLFHPQSWLGLFVAWATLKVLHELAHAIVCHRQGGAVRETGLVFVLGVPLAFVDVSSCWRMPSRWSRIAVASAGIFVELFVAALAVFVWLVAREPVMQSASYCLIITAGVSTLLFNANALMKFDGYFILSDLIEVPNLAGDASAMLRRAAIRLLTGEARTEDGLCGWRKYFVLVYGLASLIWRCMVYVSLLIAASTMFHGAGLALGLLGLGVWCGQPLVKSLRFYARLWDTSQQKFARASLLSIIGISLIVLAVQWVPIRTSIRVPAVARYQPNCVQRSAVDGIVTEVAVSNGDTVAKDDMLLRIENLDLIQQLRDIEISQEQNFVMLRQATEAHDESRRQVLLERQNAVDERLEQLRDRAAGLVVRATHAGTIIAPDLDERIGTYVREGEVLLIVAADTDKELVAVIDQQDIEIVRNQIGSNLRIYSATSSVISGKLERVEPRATDSLPNPTFAATEGGPLAVQLGTRSNDELRFTEPRFRALIQLESAVAAKVPVGMRFQAVCGVSSMSLARRFERFVLTSWHEAWRDTTSE